MEPRVIDRAGFHVLGLPTILPPEKQNEEAFREIWSGFEERLPELSDQALDDAFYGISFPGDQPGGVEYLAAMEVAASAVPPEGMLLREIPPSRYAVFECPMEGIGLTYRFIFGEWLPGSSFAVNPAAPVFEQYPPEGEEASPVRIHVPVSGVGEGNPNQNPLP